MNAQSIKTEDRLPSKGFVIASEDRDILDRILAPAQPQEKHGLTVNEGYRHVCYGKTKSGKTSLMRAIVYYTLMQRLARFALIHDTKGIFPEYPKSIQVSDVRSFTSRGGFRPGDIPVVSFRGDPLSDTSVTTEEVAAYSLMLGRKGIMVNNVWTPNPHLTVIDELGEATTKSGRTLEGESVAKLATMGRKIGISLLGTTQMPKESPEVVHKQASSISYGRMDAADVNYLADRWNLPGTMVDMLRGPDNKGLPKFHFLLTVDGEDWDGESHVLNKHTVSMFE